MWTHMNRILTIEILFGSICKLASQALYNKFIFLEQRLWAVDGDFICISTLVQFL
jgi:hypothetical protein